MRSAASRMRTAVGTSPSSDMGPPALVTYLRASQATRRRSHSPSSSAALRRHPMPETLTQHTERKSFTEPGEVREFPHGRAEIVTLGDAEIGRLVLEPGWRWSNDVK